MENFDWYRHTTFITLSVTGPNAGYSYAQPAVINNLGPSINPVTVNADEFEMTAPLTNTDVVFVSLENSVVPIKPIAPGETKKFSGPARTFFSALAGSGTQVLQVTAFYR